jgi:GT2 family glycosyltransferase
MLKSLTVVILTCKTSEKILNDCIRSIHPSINIFIIENSDNVSFKKKIKKKYPNIKVFLTGSNLGYGGGNNYGLKRVNSKYALICNPDIIFEKNFFKELKNYLKKKLNFYLMGISYKKGSKWATSGYLNEFHTHNSKLKNKISDQSIKQVDWIIGCSFLINLDKFKNKKFFDERFFLYFEEMDLCRRIRLKNGKIYSSSKLIVKHLGNQSSSQRNPKYKFQSEILRNWHWMWSTFYYFRKHYGYLYALKKTYRKFIKFIFRIIFHSIFFDKKKYNIYLYRFLGLLNSMLGRKSWYRNSDFNI